MTEQLQHQDPLKPMDNTQMVAQMAQMSTVQGITDLNKTVKGFQESMASDQVLRGAALVGHQVLVPSEKLVLEKEAASKARWPRRRPASSPWTSPMPTAPRSPR